MAVQGGKGGTVGQVGRHLMTWQFGKGGRLVSREGGIEFKDKVLLYCSMEAKCEQGFTAGIL